MVFKKFGGPEKLNPVKQKEDYVYIEIGEDGKPHKKKLSEILKKLLHKKENKKE